MQSIMKTRQDNNVICRTGLLYAENETKFSWPIRQGAVYNDV